MFYLFFSYKIMIFCHKQFIPFWVYTILRQNKKNQVKKKTKVLSSY
nr:MAG TPA: hypothetical protein [Caudoviricetes sp.]